MNLKHAKKGFTLLELLIVIAILAVLGAIVIFLLNPVETLKKARDSQRISDLSTIKTALGIYLTSTSSPQLDNTTGNTLCVGGTGNDTIWLTDNTITDATIGSFAAVVSTPATSAGNVDGAGWIKVNLNSLIGGSPISNFPIDPINVAIIPTAVSSTDLIYSFACKKSPLGFEVNATLESEAFTVVDDKRAKDGGNNLNLYETGNNLTIISDY